MKHDSYNLATYSLRRLLLMVPTLFGVTLVVFMLCQFVPGGFVDQTLQAMAGAGDASEMGGGGSLSSRDIGTSVSEAHREALNKYYGFDKNPFHQYAIYLMNLAKLDFGTSFRFSEPSIEVIKERLPISIYYGLVTFILTYLVSIPLGMVKAIRHKTYVDDITSIIVFVGYAIPSFALGALLLYYFSVQRDTFPLGGWRSPGFEEFSRLDKIKDIVWHSILPLICYMIGSFAMLTMLMKNGMLEAMSADFVRTALANGLSKRSALFVHAFRNSLIPIATSFGNNISLILAGSLLIEKVFNIPGMGLLFFESLQARDIPVLMAIIFISAFLLLVGNLLSDLCVAAVDPRVRFK